MFFRISVLYMSTSFFENFLLWLPSFVHNYVYFILLILEKHTSYFCVLKYLKYIKSINSNYIFLLLIIFIYSYHYFLVAVARSEAVWSQLLSADHLLEGDYCRVLRLIKYIVYLTNIYPPPSFRSTRWTCSFDRRGWTAGWCTRGRLKFYGSTTWWWPRFGHQTPSSGTARSQSLTTWRRQTSSSALWRTAPFCTPWGRAARSETQTLQTGSQVADFCSEHWDRRRWRWSRKWRGLSALPAPFLWLHILRILNLLLRK